MDVNCVSFHKESCYNVTFLDIFSIIIYLNKSLRRFPSPFDIINSYTFPRIYLNLCFSVSHPWKFLRAWCSSFISCMRWLNLHCWLNYFSNKQEQHNRYNTSIILEYNTKTLKSKKFWYTFSLEYGIFDFNIHKNMKEIIQNNTENI